MNKKLQRELNGPSWTEVILGAALSLILGVVLAAGYLVLKPVATVKALPKEPDPKVVYYIEGSREMSKARQAGAKQKAFVQGGSVVLNEDEANVIVAPTPVKSGIKPSQPAAVKTVAAGALNFRIRDSVLQVAVPVRLNVYGLEHDVVVQARGGIEKQGDVFVFAPNQFYVGSCPIQRLPAVEDLLIRRFVAASSVPEEIVAAWQKLSEVALEGSSLRLTMP